MYDVRKTKEYKKLKSFRNQATVTGKRQITIPKEIYDYFNLKNGDQISFIEKDGRIIFEPTFQYTSCCACESTGKILNKPCFICVERGYIEKDILEDNIRLLGFLSLNAFQYHVSVGYECKRIGDNYLEYPLISLKSEEYSEQKLEMIRDCLQSKMIKRIIESDWLKTVMNSDAVRKGIEDSLRTEKEKDELLSWFDEKCKELS